MTTSDAGGERGFGPWSVSLPMYDLPEVRSDIDELWAAIRRRLVDAGVGEVPAALDRPGDLHRCWEDPRLLLSQACGYPLVGALSDVSVVGVFASSRGGPPGHYRSVVVGTPGGRRRAVNDTWSLSGCISLLAADGAGTDGRAVVLTGSHRASIAAVRRGEADVASIDAVTFQLLGDHAPSELDGVRVAGRGPSVPCLPLITADASLVPVLRSILADVARDPLLETTRRRLHIADFVPLDRSDYASVAALARRLVPVDPSWP